MVVRGYPIPQLKGTITIGEGTVRTPQSVRLPGQPMSALPQPEHVPYYQSRPVRLYRIFTLNFTVEPCIDMISININQLMHISVFIKNTLKVYLKFLLPRHVSDHRGIHPRGPSLDPG